MNIDNYLLYDTLPKIDLHGYDRESARVSIEDFIRDSIIMKNEYIVIVHGIGGGIIRKTTEEVLKKHKKVKNFKSSYFNPGMTVVQLIIE